MRSIAPFVAALLIGARADAQIGIVSPPVHETVARAGDRYRGTITVTNTGPDTVDLTLRLADYHRDADGAMVLEPAGLGASSNALWVVLAARRVTIAPGDTLGIPFGVRVPPVAPDTLAGTYRCVIVVEPHGVGPVEIVTHVGEPSRPRITGGRALLPR